MAVPSEPTYSVAAIEAANIAFRDLIDEKASAGKLRIRDSSDNILVVIDLDDPSGTVDGVTGELTLAATGGPFVATFKGTAAYGQIVNGDLETLLSLPAKTGTSPEQGYLVLLTTEIVVGAEVSLESGVIV